MKNMFSVMASRLSSGEALVLVTVIASSGATPRGAGARMLVGKEGRICGTIGGGAVEHRSEHIALQVLADKSSRGQDFSLTKDDVQNLGMICGGAVQVFFRYLPAGDEETLALCREAAGIFESGYDLWLLSELSDEGRLGIYSPAGGFFGVSAPDWVRSMLTRHPESRREDGRCFYAEQISSSGRVYVFGCGHVAQALVPALSRVGFRCVALDDRQEFADAALFPDTEEVLLIDFENIAAHVAVGAEDYVCVMTRGHAFDTVVLAQVLRTPACYIGVIGSRAKKAGAFKKLSEEGFTEADFARITSPIGLEIRAETPAEIAVSITAQMILFRAERSAQ